MFGNVWHTTEITDFKPVYLLIIANNVCVCIYIYIYYIGTPSNARFEYFSNLHEYKF